MGTNIRCVTIQKRDLKGRCRAKIFCIVVYNVNIFMCSCEVPDIFFPALRIFWFSGRFLVNVFSTKFHGDPPSESRADTCEQTDGNEEANRPVCNLYERA